MASIWVNWHVRRGLIVQWPWTELSIGSCRQLRVSRIFSIVLVNRVYKQSVLPFRVSATGGFWRLPVQKEGTACRAAPHCFLGHCAWTRAEGLVEHELNLEGLSPHEHGSVCTWEAILHQSCSLRLLGLPCHRRQESWDSGVYRTLR